MLRTQLLLKNIVTPEDWKMMEDHIQYDFLYDNQFAELKEAEMMTNRLTLLTTIEPYIGKYYSTEYVRKKILRQTDSEILEVDYQIQDEIAKGILPDPNAPPPGDPNALPPEDPNALPPEDQTMMQDPMAMSAPLGDVPEDQMPDESIMQPPVIKPKGGKI